MRPPRSIFLTLILVSLSISPARATPPTLTLSWDDCGALVVTKDFAGPGPYAQTISVEGLTQPLSSYYFVIGMGMSVRDAWQFYTAGPRGCQGLARLALSVAAAGCNSIPKATLSVPYFRPGVTDPHVYLSVPAPVSPALAPDPPA